jgi:hypothetical protein
LSINHDKEEKIKNTQNAQNVNTKVISKEMQLQKDALNKELIEKDKKNKCLQKEYMKLKVKYDELIPSKNEMEIKIKSLNDKIKSEEEKYNQILSSYNMNVKENKILNEKINNNEKIYNEEILKKNKLEEENLSLKEKLAEIKKKYNELISTGENNSLYDRIKKDNSFGKKKQNNEYNYDVAIKIGSLNELLKGWNIKYGKNDKTKYLSMKDKKILSIGLLGLKNAGKSFIISKLLGLLNENIVYENEDPDYLYVKYAQQKNSEFSFVDTPGLGRLLKESEDNEDNTFKSSNDKKKIKELEKFNIQTDNFLINFILKKFNIIICVVGFLNFNEQKLLNKLKMKDEEYKKEYNKLKKLFIIHDLKELSKKNEVTQYIDNVLFKSMTFKLVEKVSKYAENNLNNNFKYFIENNVDKDMEIYHLIVAQEGSEAGNYYNDFTYNMIIQQFDSFHFYNNSDIIKEIKEEIKSISKNIFINPITSLDDFENLENKIKLKNNFEFISNSEENQNTDFSYLTLKPKYSYYKINNNTQLLVIIEMPGQIINQKFICSKKPKNGYYLMKFCGQKKANFPENLEDQKKNGFFYSNIEEGEFEEIIKISIENYQLKSYNYKSEPEEKGIYKYYFELIRDDKVTDDNQF